jgi:peptidoglycan/LPS O-acetylase OafA/YrhL
LKTPLSSNSFTKDRFYSIDGLRGYLAILVFLHHSECFYYYLRTEIWKAPSSFYTNIGESSVLLFFMITAFLFFSKILRSDSKIDWKQLFLSRFLRLCPLYFFAMLALFFIVAVLSNFELKESWLKILYQIICWLSFGIIDAPDINKVGITKIRSISSVIWTLKYEWFFYFLLPWLAGILNKEVDKRYFLASLLISFTFILKNLNLFFLLPFLIGILSALIALNSEFCSFAKSKIASIIALFTIFFSIFFYKTSYAVKPTILVGLAFVLIACGNDLFGLFRQKFSQILGQISYSIYLLHSIFLFVTFYFIFGFEKAALFSVLQHWLVIAAITPFMLYGSFCTFHLIEKRFMAKKN